MNLDVIGIGACTVDQLFITDQLPCFTKIGRISKYARQLGGPVANALVSLARLGVRTKFIGKVGNDDEGVFIAQELRKENVDTSDLDFEIGSESRLVLVIIDRLTGERSFTYRPDNLLPFTLTDLHKQSIASSKVLLVDEASELSFQAVSYANDIGVHTVYDGGWFSDSAIELLPLVDTPILSSDFVQQWLPRASLETAIEELFKLNRKFVIITCGNKGCITMQREGKFKYSAFPIKALDTTGAGDAFHAGFIYGFLKGWIPDETIKFASAVAAINCLSIGGQAGLPTMQAVKVFLDENDLHFRRDVIN